jgi:hypothetical protein
MIGAFERHRRGPAPPSDSESMPRVLAGFIAEHARNAGASLYYLHFSPEGGPIPRVDTPRRTTVTQVLATRDSWLVEGAPTFVGRP